MILVKTPMDSYPLITKDQVRPGIFRISHEDYHEGPGVSSSTLKDMLISPAHSKVRKDDKESLVFGRAFHVFILEQDEFYKRYAVSPRCDRRTKRGKEEYEQWLKENFGKEAIKQEEMDLIKTMAKSLESKKTWLDAAKKLESEIACYVEEDGILLKCKADILSPCYIVDIKTTASLANARVYQKEVLKWGYHISAAHYQKLFQDTIGATLPFIHIVCEKNEPYEIAFYDLSEWIPKGLEERQKALTLYKECVKNNSFPGYPDEIQRLEPPGWFYK